MKDVTTAGEFRKMVDGLKDEGQTDTSIMIGLYAMFVDDKLTLDQFKTLIETMGYELSDDFLNKSPEEQKSVEIEYDESEETDEKKSDNEESEEDERKRADKLFGK